MSVASVVESTKHLERYSHFSDNWARGRHVDVDLEIEKVFRISPARSDSTDRELQVFLFRRVDNKII